MSALRQLCQTTCWTLSAALSACGGMSDEGASDVTATIGGQGGTRTKVGGATAAGGTTASDGGSPPVQGGTESCNYPSYNEPVPPNGLECKAGVAKGSACNVPGAVCYLHCGPVNASGWRPETCVDGIIAESNSCAWTGADYSAFRVPTDGAVDERCGTAAPQSGHPCSVPPCVTCSSPLGNYFDASGTPRRGWCTCFYKPDGTSSWTCGAAPGSWPCPGMPGC